MYRFQEIVLIVLGLLRRLRFTPVGDSIIEFEWLDLNGEFYN